MTQRQGQAVLQKNLRRGAGVLPPVQRRALAAARAKGAGKDFCGILKSALQRRLPGPLFPEENNFLLPCMAAAPPAPQTRSLHNEKSFPFCGEARKILNRFLKLYGSNCVSLSGIGPFSASNFLMQAAHSSSTWPVKDRRETLEI